MERETRQGLNRRTFLRRAALAGAAAAWTTPIIQTVTASPAFAEGGTPRECGHSFGQATGASAERADQGCMGACQEVCHPSSVEDIGGVDGGDGGDGGVLTPNSNGDTCDLVCSQGCPNRNSDDPVRNQTCCDAGLCNTSNWTCDGGAACYRGPLGGIPGVSGVCPSGSPICG